MGDLSLKGPPQNKKQKNKKTWGLYAESPYKNSSLDLAAGAANVDLVEAELTNSVPSLTHVLLGVDDGLINESLTNSLSSSSTELCSIINLVDTHLDILDDNLAHILVDIPHGNLVDMLDVHH